VAAKQQELAVIAETVEDRPARRGDVSRQQILDVAARLFSERGYRETSLRDLASEVGMKAGSLYYHFASKEELAREVLRLGIERVQAAVVSAVAQRGAGAPIRDRLHAAIEAHLETLLVQSDYTSAHIRCFPYVPPALRPDLALVRKRYEAVWQALLGEAHREGALPAGVDPGHAMFALLGALNWSLEWFDPARGVPVGLARTLLSAFTVEAKVRRNPDRARRR
jgi:TetR/AcrR family transcriptional regulator, cholesterol catabolism regulator